MSNEFNARVAAEIAWAKKQAEDQAELDKAQGNGLDPAIKGHDTDPAGGPASNVVRLFEAAEAVDSISYDLGFAKHRFPLVRFKDVELSDGPRCIVEDLIPYESLIVVWGPPKSGKSFYVFDLVMHIALGREYRGRHHVEQGPVLYIAAEGELGIKARVAAFRRNHLTEDEADPPFYLLTTRLNLVADLDKLILDINDQLPGQRCLTLVLDTLNRTIQGSESKDEDMGAYRDAADRLREKFHCAVIIIHHCGINGDRPRGHTSLTGAVDAQFAVSKHEGDPTFSVTLELMKDGPTDVVMSCKLISVEVGSDRNGKPITSCIIEHLDTNTERSAANSTKKLPAGQKRALEMLIEAINRVGEIPPADTHIPINTRCVSEDLWREYCFKGGISKGDGRSSKRMAFERASDTLIGDGHVGCWNSWVWPVRTPGVT